mmetsp:Transcript_100451/g.261844  ORF Transcript_100451/g.261844 Transcript_100451/m.261844 type:complete len:374 (-) Transcript_100451:17-1138(-)
MADRGLAGHHSHLAGGCWALPHTSCKGRNDRLLRLLFRHPVRGGQHGLGRRPRHASSPVHGNACRRQAHGLQLHDDHPPFAPHPYLHGAEVWGVLHRAPASVLRHQPDAAHVVGGVLWPGAQLLSRDAGHPLDDARRDALGCPLRRHCCMVPSVLLHRVDEHVPDRGLARLRSGARRAGILRAGLGRLPGAARPRHVRYRDPAHRHLPDRRPGLPQGAPRAAVPEVRVRQHRVAAGIDGDVQGVQRGVGACSEPAAGSISAPDVALPHGPGADTRGSRPHPDRRHRLQRVREGAPQVRRDLQVPGRCWPWLPRRLAVRPARPARVPAGSARVPPARRGLVCLPFALLRMPASSQRCHEAIVSIPLPRERPRTA